MQKQLKKIAKRYGLKLMILFGSVAQKRENRHSDVDIAILPKTDLSIRRELELRKDLFELFRREIDLSYINRASPLLLGQIAMHGKILYGNPKDYFSIKIYAMKRYLDFHPYFQLREKIVKNALT